MAVNPFTEVDYLAQARSRVTEQFKNKPIFDKYVQLLLTNKLEASAVLRQLMQLRSIDTAQGVQLDIIGDIVGQPRVLLTADQFKFFGFQGAPNAGSMRSLLDASQGSPFYSLGDPLGTSRKASDEEYRLLIKAKIIKNRTLSRPEDIIGAYKFLFGASRVQVIENNGGRPAQVTIGIGKVLSTVERGLLFDLGNTGTLLPKTAGVTYEYVEFTSTRVFATAGFPGGSGVGDLNDPNVGGFLANLIT